jgi:hypothetical protein
MLPQKPISSVGKLTIKARLSMNGQPMASAGDWQSPVIPIPGNTPELLVLTLNSDAD